MMLVNIVNEDDCIVQHNEANAILVSYVLDVVKRNIKKRDDKVQTKQAKRLGQHGPQLGRHDDESGAHAQGHSAHVLADFVKAKQEAKNQVQK